MRMCAIRVMVVVIALAVLPIDGVLPPWSPGSLDAADRRHSRDATDRTAAREAKPKKAVADDDDDILSRGNSVCKISKESPLHKNSYDRGHISAQIRTGVTHQQRALTLMQGDNPQQLQEAAKSLCESYVLFRFARRGVAVPDNEKAALMARKKNLPTDQAAAKQLNEAMVRIREANKNLRESINNPKAPDVVERLAHASRQLTMAMNLGQQVLRRF